MKVGDMSAPLQISSIPWFLSVNPMVNVFEILSTPFRLAEATSNVRRVNNGATKTATNKLFRGREKY